MFSHEIERKRTQLEFIQKNYQHWKEKGMQDLQEVTLEYGISYYENAIRFLEDKQKQFEVNGQ